ncbi:D-alanyl-D-alanine carboxypeptidase family protein [Halobacillus sp. Marseille-Q1614]|uniref:D-alanyl-D-alanine carboxypeptidase family protein n=1 Tax=Halobacillus sp. Marseille-Q1614 TaxID=2709134 RepID=UPI0015708D8E|nr:D-alanyl-D-alanine carboxypeptidase family protein [Halobacillus sp. Marseille-Q1614]
MLKKMSITLIIIILSSPPVLLAAEKKDKTLNLLSEAAIVIDETSGTVLYEKNADQQMYPASLTKIATAIYAIETADLEDKVTVSQKAREADGTRVYLEAGEEVTLDKLVKGLLVNSGNDAGIAIAEHISGDVEQFSKDLNDYLREEVGLKNTHFKNPHGLYDPEHKTTAEDLAILTRYALKNPTFSEYFGMKELDWKGKAWETKIISHHKLLIDPNQTDITGGKTGYVNQSGTTLSTSAERDNFKVIVITLKSESQRIAYQETQKLIKYAFDNFEPSSIAGNKVYKFDGKEYETPEELHFVKPKEHNIEEEITNNGILEINSDTREDPLLTFQLEEVQSNGADRAQEASVQSSTSTASPNHWIFRLFYYWQLALL